MSIEQTVESEEVTQLTGTTADNQERRIDAESLARLQMEARRLRSAVLSRLIRRLFARKRKAAPKQEDAMEQAFHRCHRRDAEILRRVGQSAARALAGRAVTGAMNDHMLDDIGITRRGARNVPDPRVYNPDAGSTAA